MNTTRLRIGTWNVQYGRGERNTARVAVLRDHDADVWVLTETHDDLDLSATHPYAIRTTPRYPKNAHAYWTTVWTRLPVIETIVTVDASRTVAVRLEVEPGSTAIVYGTVLPWYGDKGPNRLAKGWDEFHRVTPTQGAEWRRIRQANPAALFVVAGDLNQSLGNRHYYGTVNGRALLHDMLRNADLTCLTEYESFAANTLVDPPIDHICAAAPQGYSLVPAVTGWNKDVAGVRLSDHSGVFADVSLNRCNL